MAAEAMGLRAQMEETLEEAGALDDGVGPSSGDGAGAEHSGRSAGKSGKAKFADTADRDDAADDETDEGKPAHQWTPVNSDDPLGASVRGFEVRRYGTTRVFTLWRLEQEATSGTTDETYVGNAV